MTKKLDGLVQIVTGAGSGLGQATALRFADEGAKVVCADLNSLAAKETATAIERKGGDALAVEADVSSWEAVQAMAAATMDKYGRIDGVYANAGIPGGGSILDVDLDYWQQTLNINLTGAMLTARAVLPQMIERGTGSILFTASISGLRAFPNQAAYAATKGGVIALARQMSLDLARLRIRVNSICPGAIRTPLVEELYRQKEMSTGIDREEALSAMASRYPLGLGSVEDIASMATYLQSPDAGWITGANYAVDGGFTA